MGLLQGQRLRQHPQLLAVPGIEPFPQAALVASVAPEPAFAALRRAAGLGLGRLFDFFALPNHKGYQSSDIRYLEATRVVAISPFPASGC
jgi:hypothetical protein